VLNKSDLLDEVTRARLGRQLPGTMLLSAATGEGVEELLATLAARLPHPETTLTVLLPFERGDLVDRAHREAEVLTVEHLPEGTGMTLRVHPALASALAPYASAEAAPAPTAGNPGVQP
jgi:GTP-binding protein HflX